MIPPEEIPEVFSGLVLAYLPIILLSVWMICIVACYKSRTLAFRMKRRIPQNPKYPDFEMDLNRDDHRITQERNS